MPIKVKNGNVGSGAWSPVVVDGKLRLKWGGSTWKYPGIVRVKNGNVGSGYWVDSDYRGYPNEPTGFSVATWDNTNFNDLTMKWNAPSGGAAVAHYEVQKNNAANNVALVTKTDAASPSSAFGMAPDEKVQFWIRAVSAADLKSDWVGPVKVLMGHKEEGHYRTENRTRDWYREVNGPWYRDAYTGGETVIRVPPDVVIKRFHYDVHAQGGFTSVLSPYGSRTVHLVAFNVDLAAKNMGSPFTKIEYGIDLRGDADKPWFGLRCRGEGWSSSAGGAYKMLGTFGITGTETYQVSVYVEDVSRKTNSYW